MESETLYKAHDKFTKQANKKVESLQTFHLYIIEQAFLLTLDYFPPYSFT